MNIDVALEPSEVAQLAHRDLSGTTCVVWDILRATSSMVTALEFGVREIVPVCTIEEAWEARKRDPEALLGGERHGERIEGFDLGNSPFEYRQHAGRKIVTTTTNGTVALRACAAAHRVWVGALLNLGALAEQIRQNPPSNLLLVCAGTFETLALEDVWAAGRLLLELRKSTPGLSLEHWTDAAQVALATATALPDPLAALRASRNGRALAAKGRAEEVDWCARLSSLSALGEMKGGVIRAASDR